MSKNHLFALACSVLIHSVAWGQTPSENLIEDPQPASVNLKAKRIDPDPKFKVPVGTKVRILATHETVNSPTYMWGERCVPITASLNHEDWNTATIEFCAPTPGMGEFQVELTHASPQYENGVIAKCTVVWEPPDEVVVQLGPVTNKGDGWYYCPHTYTIKSIGKHIGKCAELCVQESVTWEAKNAFRRFQPIFDSI